MKTGLVESAEPAELVLLSKDRTILERPLMEFPPFGLDEEGRTIRDLSGMSIRAIVLFLEKTVARERGEAAAHAVAQQLCELLNHRIRDPVYHVTPEILRNPWNSYSYEFAAYLYEFCERITGDPRFVFHGGTEKASPIMQVLARPFSLGQIYGMFPYFGNKFATGSIECRVVEVTQQSATLAMRFADRTLRQFGPFRRRCAHLMCQAAQGIIAAVPVRVHSLPPPTITAISCIANDDVWCQWVIRWDTPRRLPLRRARPRRLERPADGSLSGPAQPLPPKPTDLPVSLANRQHQPAVAGHWPGAESEPGRVRRHLLWSLSGGLAGAASAAALWWLNSAVAVGELLLAAMAPLLIAGIVINRDLWRDSRRRETLVQEQFSFVEARHEELREAYLKQEQTRVELRRKVTQLTALHHAGLLFSSTLDREALLHQVLETLTRDLHYDRAMLSFYDPVRRVAADARIMGVPPDVEGFVRSRELLVTDEQSVEGMVLLQGRSLLIGDLRTVWDQLHPANRTLAAMNQTKAAIVVPLKAKDRVLGMLTVERTQEHSLTQDDVDLMTTLGNQVAIAMDNAAAYQQIEEWNARLELKVKERTADLERADQLRAQFLSHVSHELKTPLTSIKGFLQNLLDGLTGPLNRKQQQYVSRMLDNSDRLIRMIGDLLDRTSIEAGRVTLMPADVDVPSCLVEVMEQLRPLAQAKRQRLDIPGRADRMTVWADRDRLIQVIVNLVQNAIKYTPEGGTIVLTADLEGPHMARIAVRDTGPGIPADCLDKIFDPFFRVQQESSGPKGLGLGLSIVKTLVELQGGRAWASNHPRGGAELSFTVPVLCHAAPTPVGATPVARTILVVDDDPDIRQLLLDRLEAQGYRVRPAADSREALEVLGGEPLCGAILDIGVGPMDGLDLLHHIRVRYPDLPVLMITASGSQESAVRAIGMGAQAYLLKPFEAGALRQILHTWFPVA